MFENVLHLVSYGYYGGVVGDMFSQWEQMGFFAFVLPFLLIFAIVFGVLDKIQIFGKDSRGVNAIIAIVVGLIAVNTDFVPRFFSEVFPQLGVGLSILLVVVILLEFFLTKEKGKSSPLKWVYIGIGFIIFLIILSTTSYEFGYSTYLWGEYWSLIVGLVFIVAIVAIIVGKKDNDEGLDN
jgi:hypothetical protein